MVQLPFREDPNRLGTSREIAIRRLMQLERRFEENKDLREQYISFRREYQELGRMSPVDKMAQDSQRIIIYLPHYRVLKESRVARNSAQCQVRPILE